MIQRIYKKECSNTSHPFPTAVRKLGFMEAGYAEEEYFFEGTANVYEETGENTRRVIHEAMPYLNRFLVRKPADGGRFSGNIVVEILNATAGFDIDRMWVVGAKELMRSGDIYVGITSKPDVLDSMKKADPDRYGAISWKISYDRYDCPCEGVDRAALPRRGDCETGLFWDMLTELAEVLRTDTQFIPEGKKRYLYLAGWSQSATYMYTYLNYFAFPEGKIETYEKMGKMAAEEGMQFLYHNHYQELQEFNGHKVLDLIVENTDPAHVNLELDTFWVLRGGVDPVELMKRYGTRIKMLHQKDFAKDTKTPVNMFDVVGKDTYITREAFNRYKCSDDFVEIGYGQMDIQKIIDTALEIGSIEYIVLEQDATKLDQLESVKRSMEGFRKFEGIIWE